MSKTLSKPQRSQTGGGQRLRLARRVIVVDDDPLLLESVTELMTMWGFNVSAFSTFEQARTRLADGGAGADVLLVDVRLGMYNGLQLLHLAKQMNPEIMVIAMSGFDDPVLQAEAETLGAIFLVKPFEPGDLQKQLSRIV